MKVTHGTVERPVIAFEVCPKCGKPWFGGGSVHAPHFRAGVLVDCMGAEVSP